MRLTDLLNRLHAEQREGLTLHREPARADKRVCDFTEDSRTAMPGSLFAARPGLTSDGRNFIDAAAHKGAAAILTDHASAQRVPQHLGLITTDEPNLPLATAILAEAFYDNPSQHLTIAAITGTNGKTTTAHLLHQILNQAQRPAGLIGTVVIDDGASVAPADMTTPAAADLSLALRTMLDNNRTHAVLEASSHALHQSRLAAINPNLAVFTNLSGDHLDYHKTIDAYANAKAILFDNLPPTATAILNHDDPHAARMRRHTRARAVTTSLTNSAADVTLTTTRPSLERTRLTIANARDTPPIDAETTLIGDHNLHNLLQAAAAALALGLEPEEIAGAIPHLTPPAGRLERVSAHNDDLTVFVDFAHTDDALAHTLRALRDAKQPHQTLTAVFGAGGDRDPDKRPRMGRAAAQLADRVVVTSDNPRSESPSDIIADILAGMTQDQRRAAEVHPDRAAAIAHAVTTAAPNEIIAIAGKGHEQHQITADPRTNAPRRTPFSDHAHARAALDRRRAEHAAQPGTTTKTTP